MLGSGGNKDMVIAHWGIGQIGHVHEVARCTGDSVSAEYKNNTHSLLIFSNF